MISIKTSEEIEKKGEAFVIYGKPGAGKTTFCGDLEKVFVIDADDGVVALKGKKGIVYATVKTESDVKQAIAFVKTHADKFKSIVVDTITAMESSFLYERSLETKMKTPGLQDYGKIKYFLEGVIVELKALTEKGLNIYFIAHEKRVEETNLDGTSRFVAHPDLRDTSMNFLESRADAIMYLTVSEKPETKDQRFFMLKGTSTVTAKRRGDDRAFCRAEELTKGEENE